jgi:hypothetical protein
MLNSPPFNIISTLLSQVFDGNCDHVTPVMNLLERDVRARYMRIYPIKYIGAACLRVEVYGC